MSATLPTLPTLLAHGVGERQDLPLPLGHALVGAAVALVVSFAALGLLWRRPRLGDPEAGTPVPVRVQRVVDSSVVAVGLRALGLLAAGYVLLAALVGPDLATNPTAGVVYVLGWVGLLPASLLLGPVWRAVNPLRSLHALAARAAGLAPERGLRPLPLRVGYRPAAAGLAAFVWLELVAPDRATLPVLRVWLAGYAAVHLVAAAVYGSGWFDRGDAFEVFSGTWARLSPWGRRADGALVLRSPLDNAAGLEPAPGLVAVVAVLLGSTAFDSLSNAPAWIGLTQGGPLPPVLAGTLGLAATVLLVAAAYTAAISAAARLGRRPTSGLPGQFAHTLVPIALGYFVAHYYSLLVLEGQRTLIQLSDPLGTGADWLGLGGRAVSPALVDPTAVATLQVLAVVTGHVLGVVLAHDRAVRLFPRRQALAGQLPLLALMVAYTVAGLLLLFAG